MTGAAVAAADPGSFPVWRARLNAELLRAYPEHVARLTWDRATILDHQSRALRGLLRHATTHSPFHARRLADLDLDRVDPTDLSALPVMTKADLMDEFDLVATDRRVVRSTVESVLAATGFEPRPLLGSYLALTSGGSSGRRGVVVQDEAAGVQYVASLTRGLVARLGLLDGAPPGGLPIAMVAAPSAAHPTGLAAPMTAARELPFHYVSVPVTQPVETIVARLNELRPPMLFGYPSVLARLAEERRAGRLEISPMALMSSSETLTAELRDSIRSGFDAPVIDAFGSTEGLIGASGPDDEAITFAEDGCIVELVDDQHRPVPVGTPSSKVLITVLTNRLQPLIRYELGDSFTALPSADGHGYLRATVHGRSDEAFRYGELTVHPLVVRAVLGRCAEVAEYQVRQTPDGIDATLVVDGAGALLDTDVLGGRLTRALAEVGLERPRVRLRAVAAIERDPVTGKLPRFIPLR